MKGFLTRRLDMVQQKSAERKYLFAQSESKIVNARVKEELMPAQLDESRYHEEHLREENGHLREVITMLHRH
jgi:hypothetical protein